METFAGFNDLAAFENDAGKGHLGLFVGLVGMTKLKTFVPLGGSGGRSLVPPMTHSVFWADDFAVAVEKEDGGAGGFDSVAVSISHRQFHDGFSPRRLRILHFNRQFGVGRAKDQAKAQYANKLKSVL